MWPNVGHLIGDARRFNISLFSSLNQAESTADRVSFLAKWTEVFRSGKWAIFEKHVAMQNWPTAMQKQSCSSWTGFVSVKPLLSLDALFISTLKTLYSFMSCSHIRCALLSPATAAVFVCVATREIVTLCLSTVAFTHRATTHSNVQRSNAQRLCERPLKLYNVSSVDMKSASNDKSGLTETNPVNCCNSACARR